MKICKALKRWEQYVVFLGFGLFLAGCTVWKTDRSWKPVTDRNGNITEVDETRSREGQPYYLPKGILHLTINKTGGAEPEAPAEVAEEAPKDDKKKSKQGAATGQTQAEGEVDPVSGMPLLPTVPSNDQSTQGKASANGNAYTVSLGVDYEADASAGVFYARYSPNVMFKDQVGLQVNNKRLLHSVQAKTKDETRAVVDNLADTVTNMIQFSATKGLGVATGQQSLRVAERPGKKLDELINIVIKDLNIDERFDPLVAGDREKIKELFRDDIGARYALLSPLKVEFHVVEGPHGTHRGLGKSERQGLFFREPVQVEVVLTRNPKIFQLAQDNLTELVRLVRKAQDESETAKTNQKIAQKSARERAAQKKAAEPAKPKDPVDQQITDSSSPNKPEEGTPEEDAEVSEKDAYLVALQKKLKETESLYFRAQAGASATVGRLSAVVASKQRLYTVNIKRGAFIERATELQVTNGVAMGIGHQKPSEVLGFTEIPLSISKKILALPKAIFSTKKDVATERKAYLDQVSGGND